MQNNLFKQFHFMDELNVQNPNISLGRYASHTIFTDPRRFVFMLARYKFVSKMLDGKNNVVEVGCSDGFGSNIVKQNVENLTITDFDQRMVDEAKEWRFNNEILVEKFNFIEGKYDKAVDAIYLLDVFEHIDPKNENIFIGNIADSLPEHGVCIVGMPSLESQTYASASSREGHVNCKSGGQFVSFMKNYFHNCFLFSMNDEVVHTGFSNMAHYLICVCASPKKVAK